MAPVAAWCPGSRKDVVVLIEVISSLVPFASVAQDIRSDGIIALVVANHIACQHVKLIQTSLIIHIFISADSILKEAEVRVVISTQHTAPSLTGLLEVADVLVAYLEVIAQPGQSAIVRTRAACCAVYITVGSCLVISTVKNQMLAEQTCREAGACMIGIVRTERTGNFGSRGERRSSCSHRDASTEGTVAIGRRAYAALYLDAAQERRITVHVSPENGLVFR